MATFTVSRQWQPSVPESLSPQQLHEWAIWWGSHGGGASYACRRKPLSPQQRREWAVRWGATTVVTYESSPAGSAASRCGGLHLPSFAKNLVATSVLQDQWVAVTQPGGELVAICTDSRTGEHLATFTRRPGSGLCTLTTESALVAESGQVAALVEVVASCSCCLLTHQTLLWHHHLGHPSLPRLRGMHSHLLVPGLPRVSGQGGERYFLLVVDDYTRYTTVFPLQSKAEVRSVLIHWIRA
ncbi:unnamed protein product, partial [Closterium sp. NIES-53]